MGHEPFITSGGVWFLWVDIKCISLMTLFACVDVLVRCMRLAMACGSGVVVSVCLYRLCSFCRLAFGRVQMYLPSASCISTSF